MSGMLINVLNEYGSLNPFIENDCCLASIYWSTRDDIKELILEAKLFSNR